MGTELATTTTQAIAAPTDLGREQVELIKRTICKGATDDELALFVQTSNRLRLDPFARQIFAVKRWDSKAGREIMSIQVSIDGFRLVAERTGRYAPGRPTEYVERDGQLVSATAYVKKMAGGVWHEVAETAHWSEYVQTTKDGRPTAMWSRMPHVMLAKCAESRALRRAFPAELAGVYTDDEMQQSAPAEAAPQHVAVIDVQPEPAAVSAVRETFPGSIVTHPIPEDEAARIKAIELDKETLSEDVALLRSAVEDLAGAGDENKEARRLVFLEFGCSSRANAKNPYDKFLTLSHSDRQSIVRLIDHKIDMKRTGMKLPDWAGPERQPGQEG